MPKIGVLFSRLRVEEKWIFEALESRGVDYDRIDDRKLVLDSKGVETWQQYDCVLERSISYYSGLYALKVLNGWGIRTVNTALTAEVCGDKLATSCALEKAGIHSLVMFALSHTESALDAIEALGYPVVIKPVVGSWGSLLAKLNDRDAAEAILEHKSTLGSALHSVFYIQEYIDKPGRDIRAIVIDGKVVTAIYRKSQHWIPIRRVAVKGKFVPSRLTWNRSASKQPLL
jgi:[lysine-biosynthesis-protein LysW]--L-2-aminoadipate ligase